VSDGAALLRLMTWLSPAFPVGAFGWSHGLEAAIAEGLVRDAESARGWIAALIGRGSGWNDLVLFASAYRAAMEQDEAAVAEVGDLALALAGSAERRAETAALGEAFAAAAEPWGGGPAEAAPYLVAVARVAAANGVPLGDALVAFAHAFSANLLSVAVRLVPLGQSQAVAVSKALEPVLLAAAGRAEGSSLDDLGQAALWSDIAAMRHETLQPRLFRS
jgi:urease accessory protein